MSPRWGLRHISHSLDYKDFIPLGFFRIDGKTLK